MKAAIFEAPRKLVFKEVEKPVPGDSDVLIKVKACGVCGTDVHTFEGEYIDVKSPYPFIPGHEIAGEVEGVGSLVKDFRPGDKVAVDPIIPCNECEFCKAKKGNHCLNFGGIASTLPGGFAEYVVAPVKNVYKFENVSFGEAAFAEPLSCVLYGQQRAEIGFGDDVLIMGAGAIGLLHLQLARRAGAARVVVSDLKPEKLALAKRLGAYAAVMGRRVDGPGDADHPGWAGRASNDQDSGTVDEDEIRGIAPLGYDVVIEATGVPQVLQAAMGYLKPTGRLLVFGVYPHHSSITVNPYEVYRRDIKIIGVFAENRTVGPALKMIEHGLVETKSLIARTFPLEGLGEAISMLARGEAGGKLQIIF
ncbi:MAG: zinc-dependent alcohol dehydrogenase family protein [Firmicutes bacterium]|nr:zinc-dependent alcohol dehydrogenase family protein [Bacillota bacterium]